MVNDSEGSAIDRSVKEITKILMTSAIVEFQHPGLR
jgi:hypothetical protein